MIVTGRPTHLTRIEQIITKLVAGKLAPKERETRVYNLNSTTADDLVAMVRSVYQQEVKKHPPGMKAVAVNGKVVVEDGQCHNVFPGKVRRQQLCKAS